MNEPDPAAFAADVTGESARPTPPTRRYAWIGVSMFAGLALMWGLLVASGTRVVADPVDVDDVDGAAKCQLVAASEVRCTAVFAADAGSVWSAATDYHAFNETFQSGWGSLAVEADEIEGGAVHLHGHLDGVFGEWPIDVTIEHVIDGAVRTASWDEAGDRVTVNRGSWQLSEQGDETKVVYALEVVVEGAWRPMVNVALQLVGANVVEELRRAVDG